MKKKYKVGIFSKTLWENAELNTEKIIATEETYAVSEKQAINNIKYRYAGKTSQYKPDGMGGQWEEWTAYRILK